MFVGLLQRSEVLSLGGVRHLLESDLVVVVEVPVRVLWMVEKEVSVVKGETILVAVVAREIVSGF